MNKPWMITIFTLALMLLLVLKTHEKRSLVPYFKSEPSLKLSHFEAAKKKLSPEEIPLLELWESILTGRVAPLDRWMRQEYKNLALAHVFTPSGFHLSALLWPLMLFLKTKRKRLGTLGVMAFLLSFLPGLGAFKRMTLVKFNQQIFGMKSGFLLAMLLDILFGTFSDSPLGFTYSFLFLGIVYSGARGFTIVVWFYLGQVLIAFIQANQVSPLLLITSPVINTIFALVLPVLFALGYPLWNWQLTAGIFLLKIIQTGVSFIHFYVLKFPLLEVNICFLILLLMLVLRQWRYAVVACLLLSVDLNTDKQKIPVSGTYDGNATGEVMKIVNDKVYRSGGICKRELVRGMWFETCSPRRRSRRKSLS